jgi:hypothetical protein
MIFGSYEAKATLHGDEDENIPRSIASRGQYIGNEGFLTNGCIHMLNLDAFFSCNLF